MVSKGTKRRSVEDEVRRPKKKLRKFKKQKDYHSSSEDDEEQPTRGSHAGDEGSDKFRGIPATIPEQISTSQTNPQPSIAALTNQGAQSKAQDSNTSGDEDQQFKQDLEAEDDSEDGEDPDLDDNDNDNEELRMNTALNMSAHDESEEDESDDGVVVNDLDKIDDDEQDDDLADEFDSDDPSETTGATKKKRNDPTAFATSISKILTTKLSTQKRVDPILSRSKTADEANKALADGKLETKARASIRAEKKSLLERGRVKDVLGLDTPGVDTGAIMEEEKRLKKTAQRGVVKLFNAVRAAQVKAEEAGRTTREEGMVGMHKRQERINEMSKEGFLDLISRGGKAHIET